MSVQFNDWSTVLAFWFGAAFCVGAIVAFVKAW